MNAPVSVKPFRREYLQYWYGDIARTRAVAEILSDPRPNLTLFVYGIGEGGDWPRLMRDQESRITFIAYEADQRAFATLKKRFNGIKADLYTGTMTRGVTIEADYVISFNVLGHAANPAGYLARAARTLKPDGTLYLVIDDADCRPTLDLDEFRNLRASLAGFMARHLGMIHRSTGLGPPPVARIDPHDLDGWIEAAGLVVLESRYARMRGMETLARTLPRDAQEAFILFWLAVEDQLNQRFRFETGEMRQDTINLSREMTARVVKLKRV